MVEADSAQWRQLAGSRLTGYDNVGLLRALQTRTASLNGTRRRTSNLFIVFVLHEFSVTAAAAAVILDHCRFCIYFSSF